MSIHNRQLKVLVLYNYVEPAADVTTPAAVTGVAAAEASSASSSSEETTGADAPAEDTVSEVAEAPAEPDESAAGAESVAASEDSETDSMADSTESDAAAGDQPAAAPAEPQPPALETRDAVVEGLRAAGHRVWAFNLDDDIDRISHSVVVVRPDMVVSLVEQMWADTTQPAGVCRMLDLYGYPYLGSDPLGMATCQERARTHLMLADAEVPVPGFVVVRDVNAIPDTEDLAAPLIVTQAFDDIYELEGESNPVHTREELEERVTNLAAEYDMPFVVEEYLTGRHIHALVLGNRVLDVQPLIERVVDDNGYEEYVLAQLDPDTVGRIRDLARRAFRAMSLRDIAQIDFCLAEDELPFVIDVRPAPELGPASLARAAGRLGEHGFSGVLDLAVKAVVERANINLELPGRPAPEPPVVPAEPEAGEASAAASDEQTTEAGESSADLEASAEG
jgi:D-alanine-D-alanine ligase